MCCITIQVEIIVALKEKAKKSIKEDPEIAVLTPYKAQKKLLEDLVKETNLKVTVSTINESQGDHLGTNNVIMGHSLSLYSRK